MHQNSASAYILPKNAYHSFFLPTTQIPYVPSDRVPLVGKRVFFCRPNIIYINTHLYKIKLYNKYFYYFTYQTGVTP